MSLYDYEVGREISASDPPFSSLIQSAMRKADTYNLESLKSLWPEIWEELRARYNSPGGILPSDKR